MIHEEKVSTLFAKKVKKISKELGINPNWLMHLMYFESAKTFSPSVKNPLSGATGLIQFMPATARGLGTSTGALSKMSAIDQLDYVKKYLDQYPVEKAKSYGELYLAVFYPLALSKGNDFVLGSQNGTSRTVRNQNKIFDTNDNGTITKKEVVNYQNNEAKKFGLSTFENKIPLSKKQGILIGLGTILLIIVAGYFLLKRYG